MTLKKKESLSGTPQMPLLSIPIEIGEPNGGKNENCGSYWGPGPYWNDNNCNLQSKGTKQMCELLLHGSI